MNVLSCLLSVAPLAASPVSQLPITLGGLSLNSMLESFFAGVVLLFVGFFFAEQFPRSPKLLRIGRGISVGLAIAGVSYYLQKELSLPEYSVPSWLLITLFVVAVWWLVGKARHRQSPTQNFATVPGLTVYGQAAVAFNFVRDQVVQRRLQVDRAEFIQHSSADAMPLIRALIEASDVTLHLFAQDKSIFDDLCCYLANKVNSTLEKYPDELRRLNHRGRFKISCYKTPASLNGVRLHENGVPKLLLVSWYTYVGTQPDVGLKNAVFLGSKSNPCFLIDASHPSFSIINGFFEFVLKEFGEQAVTNTYVVTPAVR